MKSGKVLLGVLAGVAAGAMLGILFAPEKGARTRKRILDKGEDYADELKEKFSDYIDSVSTKLGGTAGTKGQRKPINLDNLSDKAWKETEEAVSKVKRKFDEVKKDVNNVIAND